MDDGLLFVGLGAGLLLLGWGVASVALALKRTNERLDRLDLELMRLLRGRDDAAPATPEAVPALTAPAPSPPTPPPPPPSLALPISPVPHATPAEPRDLERFIGGRVLLVVGVLAVLLALGFFFKVAIERGWITPWMRVGIGALVGTAALVAGARLSRAWRVFGQAIMGGGLGALFLSCFFAALRYELIARGTAFGAAALITALGAWLAVRRDAPLLAWLGFTGGLLAPALLGLEDPTPYRLAGWFLVMDLGLLLVLSRRAWPPLELLALVPPAFTLATWHASAPATATADREMAVAVAALLLGLLAVALLAPRLGGRRAHVVGTVATLVALAVAVRAEDSLLGADGRWPLAAGLVACALLLGLSSGLRAVALAALASGVLTALGLDPVIASSAGVGAALLVLGSQQEKDAGTLHSLAGLALLGVSAFEALSARRPADVLPFLNLHFANQLVLCVALLLAAGATRKGSSHEGLPGMLLVAGLWWLSPMLWREMGEACAGPDPLTERVASICTAAVYACLLAWLVRRPIVLLLPLLFPIVGGLKLAFHDGPVLGLAFWGGAVVVVTTLLSAHAFDGTTRKLLTLAGMAHALLLLTREIHQWGETASTLELARDELRFRAQVAISVAWALVAALLVVAGFWRRRDELRLAGLVVFALAVGKVFLLDLARLSTGYRIGSFLALGLLLVAVSALYQRGRRREAT